MNYNFPVTRTTNPKQKPDPDKLPFGRYYTDHMFIMEYEEGKGWYDGRIVPYAPLELDPAAMVFHYGIEMFEGLKAYTNVNTGAVQLFRPDMNAKRTNRTNDRLCIPQIDEELYVAAVKAIVDVDADWIPQAKDTSLYIRPFIIATEPYLGIHPSVTYKFIIILSPSGPYYPNGLEPTKLYVEDTYTRAALGGTGEAKCGGNYACSLKAQVIAEEKGYDQILWLDGMEQKYVEEVGTSNAFFVIGDEIITAPLRGTILPGITRDSCIKVLKSKGYNVNERLLSIQEICAAYDKGEFVEMFASGTAAIISPVGELCYKDKQMIINEGKIGPIAQLLYDTIYGTQIGKVEDEFGWVIPVK
ncbi:MAG: branched-chain amino acid aminotransferase [Clostridia bacterium]|nr:branched-chain amino acid aminotransferase [Clostridia bacterium]